MDLKLIEVLPAAFVVVFGGFVIVYAQRYRYREDGGGVDTKCKFCNDNFCDEFHVLFVCNFFAEQRKKYLKKYYIVKPSTLKMHSLFNANRKVIFNLAKFIRFILTKY